jgi:hypothetical protein
VNQKRTFEIGPLPVWMGPQPAPGVRAAPFDLAFDEAGVVRLQSEETVEAVIGTYKEGLDAFHTAPPGSSDWANRLADGSLQGLRDLCGRLDGLQVMEVGGGNVYCAERMVTALGARSVTLIDPAVPADSIVPGVRVRREYLDKATSHDRQYDLVVCFSMLEHVPDPVGVLANMRSHLADNGAVLIQVPDCEASLAKGDLGICLHQHILYFTQKSLDAVLRRAGLERVRDCNLPGVLQILARKAHVVPNERAAKDDNVLDRFCRHAQRHVDRLIEFARRHKGGRAAFLGASVGLCNVLYKSGIAESLDVEVFDSNRVQTGRYLPGIATPIRATDDSRLEAHTHVFIAPVNFFAEIKAQIEGRFRPGRVAIAPVFDA